MQLPAQTTSCTSLASPAPGKPYHRPAQGPPTPGGICLPVAHTNTSCVGVDLGWHLPHRSWTFPPPSTLFKSMFYFYDGGGGCRARGGRAGGVSVHSCWALAGNLQSHRGLWFAAAHTCSSRVITLNIHISKNVPLKTTTQSLDVAWNCSKPDQMTHKEKTKCLVSFAFHSLPT